MNVDEQLRLQLEEIARCTRQTNDLLRDNNRLLEQIVEGLERIAPSDTLSKIIVTGDPSRVFDLPKGGT